MLRFFNVYYPTRTVVLLCVESAIVGACFFLATLLVLGPDAPIVLNYEYGVLKIAAVTALSTVLSYYFDLYDPQSLSRRYEIYFRIFLVLGFDCLIVSAVLFFFPEAVIGRSHVYAVGFVLLTPTLLFWREVYGWLVTRSVFRERVYVLGAGPFASSMVQTIHERPDVGMEVVEWKDIEAEKPERKRIWIETLERFSKGSAKVHRIIVAIDGHRGELPVQELLNLRLQGIQVEDAHSVYERLSGKIPLDGLRPSSFLYSEGFRLRPAQQLTRLVASTMAAAFLLLLLLPIFPLVALMVRLSSDGPIFFHQKRVGAGGRHFKVIKFRTMFIDAESAGARWATKNDPRVTKIGMFLRKTRIDELPQLWNVLRGDMGFVGPRPERPEFVPMLSEHLPFYYLRHLIRPGLTGWAQVRYGYGATLAETREKLEYDLYYIKNMSLSLDLLIMFETVKTVIRRRGAQ
jgi:sugar transferase (PEP-CTERM system associated)